MILVDPRSRSSSVVNSHQDVSITILSQISYSDGEWVLTIPRVRYFIGISSSILRFDEERSQYLGLGRDILDAFASSQGYDFVYKPYPIKRLTMYLVDGDIDFKFPDHSNWSPDIKEGASIFYSDPVISYVDGVFVKPENKGGGDIRILGSVLGFTPWDWMEKIEGGAVALKEARDLGSLVELAITGRIDGAYVNTHVVKHYLQSSGKLDLLVFDSDLSHVKSEYMMSTAKHGDIVKEFNVWLGNNVELIDILKSKYGISQ